MKDLKYAKRIRRGLKTKAIQKHSKRLRLVVYRSASHIYCQIIEPTAKGDVVRVSASTLDKEIKSKLKGTKVEQAGQVGKALAERAKGKKIDEVAFDRSGYKYHGRVKALAESAREAGLSF
jgi:large subunit ribosomal protein L18